MVSFTEAGRIRRRANTGVERIESSVLSMLVKQAVGYRSLEFRGRIYGRKQIQKTSTCGLSLKPWVWARLPKRGNTKGENAGRPPSLVVFRREASKGFQGHNH